MKARVRHTNRKDFGIVEVGNTYPGDDKSIDGTYYHVLKCVTDASGITQVLVDPTDPFPEGYLLSDTWPGDDVQR